MVDVDEDPDGEQEQEACDRLPVIGHDAVCQHRNGPEGEEAEQRAGGHENRHMARRIGSEHGPHQAALAVVFGAELRLLVIELVAPHHRQILHRMERRHHQHPQQIDVEERQPQVQAHPIGNDAGDRQRTLGLPVHRQRPDRQRGGHASSGARYVEQRLRHGEAVIGKAPEVLLAHREVEAHPRRQPHGIAVHQQDLLGAVVEIPPLQRRIDHQHPVALLGVMPADRQRHEVPGIAEQLRIGGQRAIAKEGGEQHRHDQPGHEIAHLHLASERVAERLPAIAAVENLVAVGEVRVVQQVRQQHHRRRQRGLQFGFGQHEDEGQQQQR